MVKRILLYILPFFMLVGCGRHSVDSRLAHVSELADRNTDSAMEVLSSIEKQSLNEHNRHYYDLMSIKTRDKAYQDVTGDTVITDIIDYFDGNGNDYEKGEAYYYGGRVYREMGDAPQALDYFQKALDAFPEDEAMMKGKTASQMGQIFLNMYMFEHAKPKFQEAIRYQKDCNNYRGLMLDIGALADTYESMHQNDSALCYYYEVLDIAKQIDPFGRCELETRASIVNLHISLKDLKSAQKEYAVIEPFIKQGNVSEYLLMTSINYNIISKQYNNVREIASKLTESGELHNRKYAYDVLSELYLSRGKNDISYKYLQKSKQCEDSINSLASIDAVIYQNSFYNYSLREKENNHLKEQRERIVTNSLIAILLLLLVICVTVSTYRATRKKNTELQSKNKNLDSENEILKAQNTELITSQERIRIELLQQLDKITLLEKNNETLKKNITHNEISKNIQKLVLDRINKITTEDYDVDFAIINSNVYITLRNELSKGNGIVDENIWIELDKVVNKVYSHFSTRLYYLHSGLTTLEYRVCLLIKCKFTPNEIAKLVFRDKSTISNIRVRLNLKFFGIKSSPTDFDKFIISL